MPNFIPSFHFMSPDKKLTPEFCKAVIDYCWFAAGRKNLLHGKNVTEIDQFASGDFDMLPFKKMFKSLKRELMKKQNQNPDGSANDNFNRIADFKGLDWTPLPLIPTVLNSAISVVNKIPVEVSCNAIDALAIEKKKKDIAFLKNKPSIESELQDLSDKMQLPTPDLGTTQFSSTKYSSAPMGFDLKEPDEEDIFAKLIYSLQEEAAFEKILTIFDNIKSEKQLRYLETGDQFKYGISCNINYRSSMTGLIDSEYLYPGYVETTDSFLPDYADTPYRIIHQPVTVMELFNYFSDEICDEETLDRIINGVPRTKTSYCSCNGIGKIGSGDWNTQKINLKYVEVKSIDWVGVQSNKRSKRGFRSLTTDPAKCTNKIWGQNTYGFWWLQNTDYFFGIHRLGFSHRTKGKESLQNFSSNIYKSQPKSAVELSIGENKKAQVAELKLQHTILKSLPSGKYIDLKYMRNALEGLLDATDEYNMTRLINLAFEENLMIGDTDGFDGKNEGQLKPYYEIAGGLKNEEIVGYMTTIGTAIQNIGRYTGVNQELTGQSANPEGLVGLQKLLINSSLNALYYCNQAMTYQSERKYNIWAYLIQEAVEEGGVLKQAIINFIGEDDTSILDSLDKIALHNMTIKVSTGQREEERAKYLNELTRLKQLGVISTADEYLLSAVTNPKNQFALLAIKQKKFDQRQRRDKVEQYANEQNLVKQQGENMAGVQQQKTEGDIKGIYAKGDVQANILKLANQLGLNEQQFNAIVKRSLQNDRLQGQIEKSVRVADIKNQSEAQQAYPQA